MKKMGKLAQELLDSSMYVFFTFTQKLNYKSGQIGGENFLIVPLKIIQKTLFQNEIFLITLEIFDYLNFPISRKLLPTENLKYPLLSCYCPNFSVSNLKIIQIIIVIHR